MAAPADRQWLVAICDEHGSRLHRLLVLLGAGHEAGHILRSVMLTLARRGTRMVDPMERIEFVQEQVVHQSRSARGSGELRFPELGDRRGEEILESLRAMPVRLSEILVVSHYLGAFGPELAGIMRMTVRATNKRLEEALEALRRRVNEPGEPSLPGEIEALSDEVTIAINASAKLEPAPSLEALTEELRTRDESSGYRVAWYAAAPLLALSLVAGILVAGASTPEAVEATPAPSASVVPVPTASRSLPARVRAVPVYYLGREDNRLYREERDLASTGDLVAAALDATLALAPLDPDYRSGWSAGRVLDTQLADGLLTIDLSTEAFDGIETSAQADLAALQMVYTASDLLGDPTLRLTFLADGQRPPEVFSHHPPEGIGRRGLEPMPSLWITFPRNNHQLSQGQMLITGTVKPHLKPPQITITNEAGQTVVNEVAQTWAEPNATGWRVWTLSVTLTPGSYTVRAVAAVDPESSPGQAVEPGSESKTIVVS